MTLSDFLLARFDEAERMLSHAVDYAERMGDRTIDGREFVRADFEAKRRVVEIAAGGVEAIREGRPHRSFLSGRVHDSASILAALALPYANHPDYREEWKP